MLEFANRNKENKPNEDKKPVEKIREPRYGGLGFDPVYYKSPIPSVERLDLGDIPGGDLAELACAKPAHSEPRGINEVLSSTVDRIAEKASDGSFDCQAVPIIEAWVEEVAELAKLQLQKEELRAQAVLRAKRAAASARAAVSVERSRREEAIRLRCKVV